MPDIIFVGAGPVGLFTAIQVKLHDPDLKILMLEKYEEYQRKHVLIIDPVSYKGSHPDSKFQQIISDLHGSVRTSVIEEQLLSFAREIGIQIQFENISSMHTLADRYPETMVIVGSDGAHSSVRSQLFGNKLEINDDLQYIAEIKYEVEGKTRLLNSVSEYMPAITQANHFVTEYVGKEKNGLTPVAVRFFIDKDSFDALKEQGVTFKNPLTLNDAQKVSSNAIKKLFDSINAWLIARMNLTAEKRIVNSEKITAINLPVYRSKRFVLEHDNKTWFLVGDAAIGVPYFRALNTGLISGTLLAKTIYDLFHPQKKIKNGWSSFSVISSSLDDRTPTDKYQNEMSDIADKEIFWARVRNSGVNMAISSTESSQSVYASSSRSSYEPREKITSSRFAENDVDVSKCTIM